MAAPVVMIDDNRQDIDLVGMGFAEAGCAVELVTASDGEAGLQLVRRLATAERPVPRLALLDLNLPRVRGADILRAIKASPRLQRMRVFIFSTSSAPRDQEECRALGADGYLVKPHRLDEYFAMIRVLCPLIDRDPTPTATPTAS